MSENLKVGFITTLDTNVGDDLIRDGIELILASAFPDSTLEFEYVNKHEPLSVRKTPRAQRFINRLPKGRHTATRRLAPFLLKPESSRLAACDLIIQSGAPQIWRDCQKSEWGSPLWIGVAGQLAPRIPTLNLAAGSCFGWEHPRPPGLSQAEQKFLHAFFEFATLTTVRDSLAEHIVRSLQLEAVKLPCTAFLAGHHHFQNQASDNRLLVNYMPGGGHFDWEQGVDQETWQQTFEATLSELAHDFDVEFICHDKREVDACRTIWPGHRISFPQGSRDYLQTIKGANLAICNRMHAAVAMGGMGIPAIAIGTDTRLLMVEEIGQPIFYVKDATAGTLTHTLHELQRSRDEHVSRLRQKQIGALNEYTRLLRNVL